MGFFNKLFGKHIKDNQEARLVLRDQNNAQQDRSPHQDSLDNQLLYAISHEPEKVRLLLEKGANASSITNEGISALMLACQYDDINMANALLQHGADPNSRDTRNTDFWNGYSALMMASQKGHINVVKTLLAHGAQPDVKDMYGETALMVAIQSPSNNKLEIVKMLLAHKAAVNACSDTGETALIFAVRDADSELFEEDTSTSIIEILLNYGADVNASNENGNTALISAAENGNAVVVEMLLSHGADPGYTSDNGVSALSVTEDEAVEVLIKNALCTVNEESGKTSSISKPNYICKLQKSSSEGNHSDIFYRMLLVENKDSLAEAIVDYIYRAHFDYNLVIISWAGLPALTAAMKSKNALNNFDTHTLEGVLGRKALNKKQTNIADEINQNPTGQYVIWGVFEEDHLLCNLNHRVKIAVYAVELRPGLLNYLTWINNLLDKVCLPGGGDLLSIFSIDDPMVKKEHSQILKRILENLKRTEEDEQHAIYLLQQIHSII